MHFPHRPPLMAFALKTVTAAVASAVLLSSAAQAAGLGKLTVLSALGQPLRAEIELTTSASEDASSMAVKLASPEAFRAANIEFNPALLSLRFNVEQRAGRQVIRVSSTQPLNEPFVDMLLELSWNNGRLVREYTFLLDPAELRATQSAQAAAETRQPAQPAARPAPAPAPAQPAAPVAQPPQEQARRDSPAPAPRAAAVEAPSRYRVRPGDTLGEIASKLRPADISLDMMLVALYRANPDAFIGNNMNRLKSGQILSVPDSGAIRGSGSESEARGIVIAHAADFNAYRNKLAGQVANAAPQRTPQAGQSAAGKITAKVEEGRTAANESQDQLRLSKATGAAAGAQADNGANTTTAEDAIARERELAQAQERVKELEKNVNELEQLMTVKSRSGSEAQNAVVAGAGAGKLAQAPAVPAAKPAEKARAKAAQQAKPQEKSFADTLMDNINIIAGGAAILLLAALGVSQRRKKKPGGAQAVIAEPTVPGVPKQAAHSLFAEAGGQSVDTSNSVFNSSFAPSASQLDTNEVDPVAEADVYIAYGRDAQAEEILKEALRTHPERHAVRLKLLEIYAARKDLRAFETQANELHGLTRGQGDEWAQAAALGMGIDPANPLYASAANGAAAAAVHSPSPQEREQQTLLSKQLEDAFRSGSPLDNARADALGAPLAALGAGAAAGAAHAAIDHDEQLEATAVPAADVDTAQRTEDNALDFDLGGLSFEPVGSSEPIAMTGPDAVQDETAVPDLDFALDPLGDAGTALPVDETAAPASSSEEPFDLAFDMHFGEPEAGAAQASTAEHDIDMAGLAAEFDLPPLPAIAEDEVPALATAGAQENDPLFDLDTMDFGLSAPAAPAASVAEATPFHEEVPAIASAPASALGADDPLFDLDTMDFGSPADADADAAAPAPALAQPAVEPFEFDAPPATAVPAAEPFAFDMQVDDGTDPFALEEIPAPAATGESVPGPVEPSFDLADIDLDLPSFEQPASAAAATDLPEQGAAGEAAALSPEHMEMETKLDLAIAYQEIGDKEGARELLDEVIKGGSGEQVSKASAMRSLLA
ncbi:LysM peptidoglycan-binding domain-containing protein [Massilia sp. UMI-21]|nr:LysM peptidoglycan-binding domain-containing protein [Massilia sp. UMI-21]